MESALKMAALMEIVRPIKSASKALASIDLSIPSVRSLQIALQGKFARKASASFSSLAISSALSVPIVSMVNA